VFIAYKYRTRYSARLAAFSNHTLAVTRSDDTDLDCLKVERSEDSESGQDLTGLCGQSRVAQNMAGRRPSETSALLTEHGIDDFRKSVDQIDRRLYGSAAEEDAPDASLIKGPELETTWKKEVSILARYSGPLMLTYVLQFSYQLVTVFVAGRLGTRELAAASLATMTISITGLCVYEGFSTCLDTLCSHAYGNGKKHLVGLHVQRMSLLVCVVTIPIGAVWLCAPWILAALVPETETAKLAGRFVQINLLGGPGWGIFEAAKRLCQAQGDFTASLAVVLVCAPLNILWNWLLVFHFDLGFTGAAWSVVISNNLQPIVLALYVAFIAPSNLQCWPGLDLRRACQNWGPMIKLGVPGVLMTFSEWFAFDVLTIAAGYLSEPDLAAQSVLTTVVVLMYHIPFPISIAASTRFGNLIGYGALDAARLTWRTHYLIFVCIGIFDVIVLTSCRHVIAAIFTHDDAVKAIITTVMPITAAAQFFDAVLALSNGLLRGLGRQKIGGWINLGVYYLFALPLSFFLCFGPPHMGLSGMWIGPCSGLACAAIIMTSYMRLTDWQKAVDEAREREE
jgi:multidrug resistance protein, MATE family